MSNRLHRQPRIFPRHRPDPVRREGLRQPAGLQGLRREQGHRRQDHARAPALRGLLLAYLLQCRRGSVRAGHAAFPVGHRLADVDLRGQGRCRLRVLQQARRAVLLLPRHRPGARCRRYRPVRGEPQAHGGAGQGAAAGDRRQAAVGHRQPVLASALHERCVDQPGLQRGRARGGAGQERNRCHESNWAASITCSGAAAKAMPACTTPT